MGKGDKRSFKGKLFMGSFGKSRGHKNRKNIPPNKIKILHKTEDWKNSKENKQLFQSTIKLDNGILESISYKPEILFIGTFNPNCEDNVADIFYGRNYFWPIVFYVFDEKVSLENRRDKTRPFKPSLSEIINFIQNYKIIFADILKQIEIENFDKNQKIQIVFTLKNEKYNLFYDAYLNDENGLIELLNLNNVTPIWNTERIIETIKNHPTINKVLFTRKSFNDVPKFGKIWQTIKDEFKIDNRNIVFDVLHTPKKVTPSILSEWKEKINPNNNSVNVPKQSTDPLKPTQKQSNENDEPKHPTEKPKIDDYHDYLLKILNHFYINYNQNPAAIAHHFFKEMYKIVLDARNCNPRENTIILNSGDIQKLANKLNRAPACCGAMRNFRDRILRDRILKDRYNILSENDYDGNKFTITISPKK